MADVDRWIVDIMDFIARREEAMQWEFDFSEAGADDWRFEGGEDE